MSRTALALTVVTLLTTAALAPLSAPWFVGSHDGVLAIARSLELARTLADGGVPPRWSPDWFFGYGFPFFNFYAPAGYFLAAIPVLLGAAPGDAVEWIFAAGILAGSWGTFLWLRRHVDALAAIVAGAAYAYVPYRLVDVHLRGDFSEFLALCWLPWVLWAVDRVVDRRSGGVPLLAVGVASLPLTHNVMALVLSPAVGAYALIRLFLPRRTTRTKSIVFVARLVLAAALGLALASFFWFPALIEKDTVQIENVLKDPTVDFRRNFPDEMIAWPIVYPFGRYDGGDFRYTVAAGSVQVGLAGLGALAFAGWALRRKQFPEGAAVWLFGVLSAPVCWFLMTPVSRPIWETVPLMEFVQFPWRLLGPLALLTAALTSLGVAAVLRLVRSPFDRGLVLLVTLFMVVMPNVLLLQPRFTDVSLLAGRGPAGGFDPATARRSVLLFEAVSQAIGTTSIGDYLPDAVKIRPLTGGPLAALITGDEPAVATDAQGTLLSPMADTATLRSVQSSATGGTVRFLTPLWVGWTGRADGRPSSLSASGPLGLATVEAAGAREVAIRFEGTPIQRAGNVVSLIAVGVIVVAVGYSARRLRIQHSAQGVLRTVSWLVVPVSVVAAWLPGPALFADPSLEQDAGTHLVNVEYATELTLIGYTAEATTDNRAVRVSLRWLAVKAPSTDYTAFVHLINVADQVVGTYDQALGPGARVTSRWQPGEIAEQSIEVPIPAGTPPGVYSLRVGLYDSKSLQRAPITAERLMPPLTRDGPLRLGPVLIGRRLTGDAAAAVRPTNPSPQRFEGFVRFVGFDVSGEQAEGPGAVRLRPGADLNVALYLQAIEPLDRDFTVFVHLLDRENRVVAQDDRAPAGGSWPTFVWAEGERVVDRHLLRTKPDLAPGEYEIEIGLYDSVTKQRLGVDDGKGNFAGDRIVIGKVVVTRD